MTITQKIKIVCKCGFASVFIGLPRRAMCAKCGADIVSVKGDLAAKSVH